MSNSEKLQNAVDQNYKAFQTMLPQLQSSQGGRFVLMRDEKIVERFDSARDAVLFGQERFDDGLFSIQQITTIVADFGYFSHAVHQHNV